MKLFIGAFILLLTHYGFGQKVTSPEDLDYVIEDVKLPGGRLGNNVNCIVQGPDGFMWFGSHGGLHRFDGYEFITYTTVPGDTVGETSSLTFPYVESLFWDRSDKLWVATYGGGLYRFDPVTEKFKHFAHDPNDPTTISHARVMCAMQDAQGNLWFGTEKGLNLFDPKTETFKRYLANPNDPNALHYDDIRTLYIDKKGTFWLGAGFAFFAPNFGALSKYNPDSDSFTNFLHDPANPGSLPSPAVRGILEDSEGNFWVGTSLGLSKMDREKGRFQLMTGEKEGPFAPGTKEGIRPATYSLHEDKQKVLWVGTIGNAPFPSHLARYDPKTKKSQLFPLTSSAWQITESRDGTIWVAGSGVSGRVVKLYPKFRAYDLMKGGFAFGAMMEDLRKDKNGDYRDVVEGYGDLAFDTAGNRIWFQQILRGSGVTLRSIDVSNQKVASFPLAELGSESNANFPANDWVARGMCVDKQGRIWGNFRSGKVGVYCFDPQTGKTTTYAHSPSDPQSLSSNNVIKIFMDSRGDIWAATFKAGLNRINPLTGKIKRYHFSENPEEDFPIAITEGKDGMIWTAGHLSSADSGGIPCLVRINPANDEVERINLPYQGTELTITSLAQSPVSEMFLFVIDNDGLGMYDHNRDINGRFVFFNEDTGFPFKEVSDIVYDKEGTAWVAGYGADQGNFIRVGNDGISFVFRESHGQRISPRSGTLSPEGHPIFSAWAGWIEIDPNKITRENTSDSLHIQLTDLFVQGEKMRPSPESFFPDPLAKLRKITFPDNVGSFLIRFSDFNFQDSDPLFQYRLIPYESNWNKTSHSPTANYYKLPSGSYTFQVRSNRQSASTAPIKELSIVILPPWWQTWWAYGLYAFAFVGSVWTVDRFQKSRVLRKERERVKDRELAQAKEVEKAYNDLKAAQAQLIQSEKMASLGELTAGIAHEIQNPLNFVNNFSDVNRELLTELQEEIDRGNFSAAKALASTSIDNQQKITDHGKRADAIVKSMLQHSRKSTGQKELTDINALCDEYLRLAFHGLRAKDKSFNAKFETNLDRTLPKINVVSQDIGRVLLNLINNAFYAVSEKKSVIGAGYEPVVRIATKNLSGQVEIRITDNGTGITENVAEKIFQPFYTTKPAGQGTGLGLSLSYDIVTKVHGGEIKVASKENEGTEFIIILPVK